jgi:hypothetical protein
MLASFLGVLPILTPPLCALAFIMCIMSSLMSTMKKGGRRKKGLVELLLQPFYLTLSNHF